MPNKPPFNLMALIPVNLEYILWQGRKVTKKIEILQAIFCNFWELGSPTMSLLT